MNKVRRPWWSLFIFIPTLLAISGCPAKDLPLIGINAALPTAPGSYEHATADEYTIEVASHEISTLIESAASFVVYIGNNYCTSCAAFQPAFFEYISETGMLVYHYDNVINGSDYDILVEAYPDYFVANPVTPSLVFFKHGELRTRQNGTTRMFDINTLRPIMESYAQVIDLAMIHDEVTFSNSATDGVYFIYNRLDEATISFYTENLLPLVVDDNYRLAQLEVSLNEDFSVMIANLVEPFSSSTTFFLLLEGEVTDAISLDEAGPAATLTWLTNNLD